MKKLYRKLCIFLCACLIFGVNSCDNEAWSSSEGSSSSESEIASSVTDEQVEIIDASKLFTSRDITPSYDSEGAILITLRDGASTASSADVSIADNIITISDSGDYLISGSLSNGTIIVDADSSDKVCLVLDDVSISSLDYAPIYVKKAKKVFVFVKNECSLNASGTFVQRDGNSVDATIYSRDDIVIQGDGTLNVSATSGHGIVSKGSVKITGSRLTINASEHAISAKDSIRIRSATINASAGKDALHAEHTSDSASGFICIESGDIWLEALGDGLDASGAITISGGALAIKSGGGSDATFTSSISQKGIKSASDIAITGGDVSINSTDDSLHSKTSMLLSGGKMSISSGDDGIHADSSIILTGAEVSILKSYEGIEGQRVAIRGGKIKIIAKDDGINAGGGNDGSAVGGRPGQNVFDPSTSCYIDISGGDIYVNAKGDGIDSNGTVSVSGGKAVIEGPTNNKNGPFDYDISATITGGIFVAIGSPGMAMNFSSATQGAILHSFDNTSYEGEVLSLYDGSELIFSHEAEKQFVSVLISTPELKVGGTYKLCAGSQSVDITLSETIYGKGYHSGMMK